MEQPATESRLLDRLGTTRAIANRSPARHGPDRRATESRSEDIRGGDRVATVNK
jgi:hypothetical protein